MSSHDGLYQIKHDEIGENKNQNRKLLVFFMIRALGKRPRLVFFFFLLLSGKFQKWLSLWHRVNWPSILRSGGRARNELIQTVPI